MNKKKIVRVPVFNAMTEEWIGSARFRRNPMLREYLDDVCDFGHDLNEEQCEDISNSIGLPVCAGWFDSLGENRICVIVGEMVE